MKQKIKKALSIVSPALSARISGVRNRRHVRELFRKIGLDRLSETYIARRGLCVQSGPFQGMQYVSEGSGSTLLPKLAGSYEAELAPMLARAIEAGYDRVIDIGCAEGYYAVGFAMRLPEATVLAYDTDPHARRLCRRLAGVNRVLDRVFVRGRCTPATLEKEISGRTLVICDCEGYEAELLDPVKAPALTKADIVVEFHDHAVADVSTTVATRFRQTHAVSLISTSERDPSSYPAVSFLPVEGQLLALSEFRHGLPQVWGFFQAQRA
jgi:precorrin-6B methylase 2